MKILTVNPGSTSTKIALFENPNCVFSSNITHEASKLAEFKEISDQYPYRRTAILDCLNENHISLEQLDACVGRGGGLYPLEGGTYPIDEILLEHANAAVDGIAHPATLGAQLAEEIRKEYGGQAFVVNPADVDEIQDVARMTGIRGVYRGVHLHALNLKETAIRHAATLGKQYEDCNFIVCHIGGGISVSAHRKGRMIDGYDIVGGEGPMAPTRCGSIPISAFLKYSKGKDAKELSELCTKTGGFVNLTGTSDAIVLTKRIEAGDKQAEMVWNAMIYQIEKCIGAMSCVLDGDVDGIVLGGGMVHSADLVGKITQICSWIAPVTAYPGEFEMEAMAAGALRVLRGEEKAKKYSGIPIWQGFDFDKDIYY
jgi:butyrate kinase